jgi:hypothetical protein
MPHTVLADAPRGVGFYVSVTSARATCFGLLVTVADPSPVAPGVHGRAEKVGGKGEPNKLPNIGRLR